MRDIVDQALQILQSHQWTKVARFGWRNRVLVQAATVDQTIVLWTGTTYEDVGNATKGAFHGINVGVYREGDELLPINAQQRENDAAAVDNFQLIRVHSTNRAETVPLAQSISGIAVESEDPVILRRDRAHAIVLIDQINDNLADRMTPYGALSSAGASRLRPVSLAVTIVGGLIVGTLGAYGGGYWWGPANVTHTLTISSNVETDIESTTAGQRICRPSDFGKDISTWIPCYRRLNRSRFLSEWRRPEDSLQGPPGEREQAFRRDGAKFRVLERHCGSGGMLSQRRPPGRWLRSASRESPSRSLWRDVPDIL